MSRYGLQPKNPAHEVVVGWDNPLQQFFVDVRERDNDDEAVHEDWVRDTLALVASVGPYVADFPAEVIAALERDYRGRTEPTPLQKKMTDLVAKAMYPHLRDL